MKGNKIVEYPEFVYMKERRKIIKEVGKNKVRSDKLKKVNVRSRGGNRINNLPMMGYDVNDDFDES